MGADDLRALVFQTADLPAPLADLSPWLDWLVLPRDEVYRRLSAQRHRRFIKTHTPLDRLPIDPRVTWIVTGRHPLDMAVSLYHQGDNLDRERVRQLTGQGPARAGEPRGSGRPSARDWLLAWIDADADARQDLDSLPGVLRHLSGAWARHGQPNLVLVHYDDLCADLEGEMRRLADRLAIRVPERTWPELVDAARFDRMRARATDLAPDGLGVLRDPARFFRRGSSGAGRELLSPGELARYRARAAALARPDLLAWLHRDGSAGGGGLRAQRMGRFVACGGLLRGGPAVELRPGSTLPRG